MSAESTEHAISAEFDDDRDDAQDAATTRHRVQTPAPARVFPPAASKKKATSLRTTSRNCWTSRTSMATSTSRSATDAPTSRSSPKKKSAGLDSLVGRDGEVLEALQELTRLAVLSATENRSRLVLDINGYRAERAGDLQKIAEDAVAAVKDTGEAVALDPMSAYERKIVHDAVADLGSRERVRRRRRRPAHRCLRRLNR